MDKWLGGYRSGLIRHGLIFELANPYLGPLHAITITMAKQV
jgi:hypothetical protein